MIKERPTGSCQIKSQYKLDSEARWCQLKKTHKHTFKTPKYYFALFYTMLRSNDK